MEGSGFGSSTFDKTVKLLWRPSEFFKNQIRSILCVFNQTMLTCCISRTPVVLRGLSSTNSTSSTLGGESCAFVKLNCYETLQNGSVLPDPGSGACLASGSGMGKKSGSGSRMNNPDHISESLETIFWVKILIFFDVDPGSVIEKIRIRDKHPVSATLERVL